MHPGITSKEAILEISRNLAARDGLKALNMRSVARESGIALGTLYNYFPDKEELLIATVESVWKDIFSLEAEDFCEKEQSFDRYVEILFASVQEKVKWYPDFFTAHSMVIASTRRGEAKSIMEQYLFELREQLRKVLDDDRAVKIHCFSASFPKDGFLDFVLNYLILLLAEGSGDDRILLEIIRRILYIE